MKNQNTPTITPIQEEKERPSKPLMQEKIESFFHGKQAFFVIIAIIVVLTGAYVQRLATNPDQLSLPTTKSSFCQITSTNLCEGENVEITGVVQNSKLVPGVGYLFTADNATTNNPIYLQAVRFTGFKLNGFGVSEEIPHQIPFGSHIIVRGQVVIQDKHRCTQEDFAGENPEVCKPEGFRLKIAPDAIFTLPSESDKTVRFSIFGKIKNIENAISTCPNDLILCEGFSQDNCHSLAPTDLYCDSLDPNNNMFLIIGSSERTLQKPLSPFEAYHIRGISYRNQPPSSANDIPGIINQVLTTKKSGTVTVFRKTGEQLTSFDTGKERFYDLSYVHLTQNHVYYFVDSQLYKKPLNNQPSEILGTLNPEIFAKDEFIYDFMSTGNGQKLLFVTSKEVSQKTVNNYLVRTQIFFVHQLDLNNLKLENGIIETNVLYQEEIEGFFHLIGYNANQNTMLLARTFDADNPQACRRKQYYQLDLKTQETTDITTITSEGNKYCGAEIHRQLFASQDGKYLVLGSDFSETLPKPRPNKLTVFTLSTGNITSQNYLADRSLLRSKNNQILGISQGKMTLFRPYSPEIIYTFDLSLSEYSPSALTPNNPLSPKEISTPDISPTPTPYRTHPLYSLSSPTFLFEDSNNLYFFDRTGTQKQLQILKKSTGEIFLAKTLLITAQSRIIGNNLYIIEGN